MQSSTSARDTTNVRHTTHDTIDWNRFWSEADEDQRAGATPAAHETPERMVAFMAKTGIPDAMADVGCGPGHVAFHVAERHPDVTVVGYDTAQSVVAENRDRASERNLENVRFEPAVLPAFDPGRQFDLILCHATLYYVGNPERALVNLYDAVAPGGYLVVNYPNRFTRRRFRDVVADPPDGDEENVQNIDPERFARRFRLVLEGENLLSYERIHETLDTWPRSFWSIIDDSIDPTASRLGPLVYVPK